MNKFGWLYESKRSDKIIEKDEWFLKETRGSYRQYKHSVKQGRVTIPGKMNDDIHPKTLKSIFKQAQIRIMMYAIIIEKGKNNFSTYVPDLPGCVSTGLTIALTGNTRIKRYWW